MKIQVEDQRFGENSEADFIGSGLRQNARGNFVKKVYTLLAIQLSFTAFVVALSIFSTSFIKFQATYPELFWIAFLISISTLLALFCVPELSIKHPFNMILMTLFTIAESYMVSFITSFYTPQSVLLAAVATAGATIGLTLYAMNTKRDFTEWTEYFYGFGCSIFCVIICLTIIDIFFVRNTFESNLIAFAFACIYSIYLLIDTQLILGGKHKRLSLDNYVLGAVILYIDIIGLFLELLRILGSRR